MSSAGTVTVEKRVIDIEKITLKWNGGHRSLSWRSAVSSASTLYDVDYERATKKLLPYRSYECCCYSFVQYQYRTYSRVGEFVTSGSNIIDSPSSIGLV